MDDENSEAVWGNVDADDGDGDKGEDSPSSSDPESSDDNSDDDDSNDKLQSAASAKKRKIIPSSTQSVVIARHSDQKHPTFQTIKENKPAPTDVDAQISKELKRRKEEMARYASQGIPASFNALVNVDTSIHFKFVFDAKKMDKGERWFKTVPTYDAFTKLNFGDVNGAAWKILEDLFPLSLSTKSNDSNLNSTLLITFQSVIKDFVTKLDDRDANSKQLNAVLNEVLTSNPKIGIRDIGHFTLQQSSPLSKLFITEL